MLAKVSIFFFVLVALTADSSYAQTEPISPAPIEQLPSGHVVARSEFGFPDGAVVTKVFTLQAMDEPLVETEAGGFSNLFSTPLPEPADEDLIRLRRMFWGADFSDHDAMGTRIERIEVISLDEQGVGGVVRRVSTSPTGMVAFVFADRDVKISGTYEGDDAVSYFAVNLKRGWNRMLLSSQRDADKGVVQRFTSSGEQPNAFWGYQSHDE